MMTLSRRHCERSEAIQTRVTDAALPYALYGLAFNPMRRVLGRAGTQKIIQRLGRAIDPFLPLNADLHRDCHGGLLTLITPVARKLRLLNLAVWHARLFEGLGKQGARPESSMDILRIDRISKERQPCA